MNVSQSLNVTCNSLEDRDNIALEEDSGKDWYIAINCDIARKIKTPIVIAKELL